jgi:hypothetical protein
MQLKRRLSAALNRAYKARFFKTDPNMARATNTSTLGL